jgi:hypothetical protein
MEVSAMVNSVRAAMLLAFVGFILFAEAQQPFLAMKFQHVPFGVGVVVK